MAEITPGIKRSSSTVQKPNWNWCLCHVKRNVQGKLTSFTHKSWEKFESCSTPSEKGFNMDDNEGLLE